jgi:hypothetical protein
LERRLDDERLLTGAAPDAFKSLLGVIPTGLIACLIERLDDQGHQRKKLSNSVRFDLGDHTYCSAN